jgi:hypothetical protein
MRRLLFTLGIVLFATPGFACGVQLACAKSTMVATLPTAQQWTGALQRKPDGAVLADVTCSSKDGSHTCQCASKCASSDNDCRCE